MGIHKITAEIKGFSLGKCSLAHVSDDDNIKFAQLPPRHSTTSLTGWRQGRSFQGVGWG